MNDLISVLLGIACRAFLWAIPMVSLCNKGFAVAWPLFALPLLFDAGAVFKIWSAAQKRP